MNFKNALTTMMVLTSLTCSFAIHAEEVVIPVVQKPSVLQEGTQRELSDVQIAELLPWAKNSRVFLKDLLNSLQGLSSVDKLERLEDGVKSVVKESSPKNSELLMRYILNRSLVINDLLKTEMGSDEVGTIDTKLRVFTLSINLALRYYETDLMTLSKKTNAPFINFGVDYFNFLSELNKSIFDASASYNVQRTAFEWLQWDLYRDLNNQQVAPQIVKINNSLKLYPTKKLSNTQYISYLKQMKLLAQSLDLKNINYSNRTIISNNDSNDNSYSVNFSNEVRPASKAEIIAQCNISFSNESFRNSCARDAIKYDLNLKLIEQCGNSLSSNEYRYSCLSHIKGMSATYENLSAISTCGTSLSDNSFRLSCISHYVSYSMPSREIAACGSNLSTNNYRLACIERLGTMKKTGVTEDQTIAKIATCSTSLSDNSYRLSCIEYAFQTSLSDDEIRACGSSLTTNDYRLACMKRLKSNRFQDSISKVSACGTIMSNNDYRLTCVENSLERNLSAEDINVCGQMSTNTSRLSCLSDF